MVVVVAVVAVVFAADPTEPFDLFFYDALARHEEVRASVVCRACIHARMLAGALRGWGWVVLRRLFHADSSDFRLTFCL